MQLSRNTIVPIAIGMLAIAAARAEAAPLIQPGSAGGGAVRPAMGDALLWGLDFAAKAGAPAREEETPSRPSRLKAPAAIDEAAPAIPPMACLGEETDGAIAPDVEDMDVATDVEDMDVATDEEDVATDEECPGCGIVEATWGDALTDALPGIDPIEAAEAVLFDAPTFEVAAEAPTFEVATEAPTFEVTADGVDVSSAPMPIYVALCRAVVDAVKADLATPPEAVPFSADESGDDGETAEDVVLGECCDDAAAVADASDKDALSTDEQVPDLTALVACGDTHAALAAAASLKRGLVRFFEALVRTAAERHDAVLESAEVIDEVVDAPAPEFAADHVPEVLTLF